MAKQTYRVEEGIDQMRVRKCLIALLIVAIALAGTVQVAAWRATEFKLVAGDITLGNEVVLQKPSQTLFHDQTEATTDTEALSIAFPAATTGNMAAGTGPTIAQTADTTAQATDMGYYKANWCYTYFVNNGGWGVGEPGLMCPMGPCSMLGSDLIWPYMTDADDVKDSGPAVTARFKPIIDESPGTGNISPAANTSTVNLSAANLSAANATATSAPSAKPPALNKSYAGLKNATHEDIASASGLERMWRNANLVNTIPQTYKGSVERPTWIDPNPDAVIRHADRWKVIDHALDMTQPGHREHTLFWSL